MYGEDLAFVHATGFGSVAEAAAREVLTRFPKPIRVVDLGCGAGTLAAQLVPRGHQVWGVDASTAKAPADYVATREGKGWRVEAHVVAAGDHLERTVDTWRAHADDERHVREVHHQRLLDPAWVTERLEAAGFDADPIGGYDDLPFEDGWDAMTWGSPAGTF